MADYRIALDAGHGGSDPGAVYKGRQEKDDTLDLTLAVGDILKKNGIDVYYTRTTDEYETPFKKATDANNSGADLFVSIHRNSSENPNQYSGVETLVYSDTGLKAEVASIAQAIADGILESIPSGRPGNTTSNKSNRTDNNNNSNNNSNNNNSSNSQMNNSGRTASAPIDSTAMVNSIPPDNEVFSVPVSSSNIMPQCPCDNNDYDTENEALYRVQVGAYRNKDNADRMLNSLLMDGFPAFIIYEDGYYKVQVGAYRILLNAIKMEQRLRRFRYSTYIVYS